jgi:uncharacterized protein YdcH (DUF465 family)
MNISLRKAAVLQHSIQEAIHSIKIEPQISVSEFVNGQDTIVAANKTLVENDGRRVALWVAYYNIRSLVGAANTASGINMKLATAAFVDKRMSQLQELISADVRDLLLVQKRLEKIRNTEPNSRMFGREDSVHTSVLTAEQIAVFRGELQTLKKQKQALNDEILELNIKTEIPLGDNTLATLSAEDLI